jgi:hypothetical protein
MFPQDFVLQLVLHAQLVSEFRGFAQLENFQQRVLVCAQLVLRENLIPTPAKLLVSLALQGIAIFQEHKRFVFFHIYFFCAFSGLIVYRCQHQMLPYFFRTECQGKMLRANTFHHLLKF